MAVPPLWLTGLTAVIGSVVTNLLLRWIAVAALDIPADFPPLAAAPPTIFFTVIGVVTATLVWTGVRKFASRPERTFQIVAFVALLVSLVPDLWLLTDGGGSAFPGATLSGAATLMAQHAAAAGIVVWLFTMRGR